MKSKLFVLICAGMFGVSGLVAQVNAETAKVDPASAAKAAPAKSAQNTTKKVAKTKRHYKSAKRKSSKAVAKVAVPVAAPVVASAMPAAAATVASAQQANPYLANTTSQAGYAYSNPYLPNQKPNPYLSAPMSSSIAMPALFRTATNKHISFSPLPLDIYTYPTQRPSIAFTTPCVQIEKATNGFPPILAFESFMFENIGKINASDALPFSLEPVCV